MNDDTGIVQPVEVADVQPPTAARLVVPGQSTGDVVQALLSAIQQREVSQKLGRELLVRLLPPARSRPNLRLPKITADASSYAAATRKIMAAASAGRIGASDATILMRAARTTHEAARAEWRQRFRLAP